MPEEPPAHRAIQPWPGLRAAATPPSAPRPAAAGRPLASPLSQGPAALPATAQLNVPPARPAVQPEVPHGSGSGAPSGSGPGDDPGTAAAWHDQEETGVPEAATPPATPKVTVTGAHDSSRPLRVVERALRGPSDRRGDGWRDRVVVVPGGHRPGQQDFQQRDRSRARLQVAGSRRIVVLGCTVGAGQTMTALMTGEVLARLRDEPVAVLDLNAGPASLAQRAPARPGVDTGSASGSDHQHHLPPSQLDVIGSAATADQSPGQDAGRGAAHALDLLSARYCLTLADPGAPAVPRVLPIADQLILVAPASADAARAIAMTMEWLEGHGHAELSTGSITVINGVSRQTMAHVEQAEAVARGRCRAIVRVPWDDELRKPEGARGRPDESPDSAQPSRTGLLGPAATAAYTALAGVLVAGLATAPEPRRAQL
jgi:MinD-like ATPase involved in chromosome partitioning or flagellar assembly